MRMFLLRPDKYPEEQALYREHENEIIEYCCSHIMGNWILSFELWGNTEETAIPTVILVYEGSKAHNWKDPEIKGLPFVCEEDVFWGAMEKPRVDKPKETRPKEYRVEKSLVEKKKACCHIC